MSSRGARPLQDVPAEVAAADRLHSAAIRLLRTAAREDPASGLSPARLSALSVVVFGGPLSLGALARAERVRPPTMTRLVQALERDGLVERRGGGDRRTVLLSATPRGVAVLEAGRRRRVERLAAALGTLDADDLRLLTAAAELVETALERDRATRESDAAFHGVGSGEREP